MNFFALIVGAGFLLIPTLMPMTARAGQAADEMRPHSSERSITGALNGRKHQQVRCGPLLRKLPQPASSASLMTGGGASTAGPRSLPAVPIGEVSVLIIGYSILSIAWWRCEKQ